MRKLFLPGWNPKFVAETDIYYSGGTYSEIFVSKWTVFPHRAGDADNSAQMKINMMYYADKIWNAHEMLENATTQRLTHSSGRIIWQDYEVFNRKYNQDIRLASVYYSKTKK